MASQQNVDDHIVLRLKAKFQQARALGFRVRLELLSDQQASWCILAGKPTLFVDLSQTAAEQLRGIDEALADYLEQSNTNGCGEIADKRAA